MSGQMASEYHALDRFLTGLPTMLGQTPSAVLMISAHWEEAEFTLQSHPQPPMLYDYHGFPAHTYRILYPAPGDPALARRARDLLQAHGIAACCDAARGFDHGAFVPMSRMFPDAGLPMVQLSLKRGLDPAAHLQAGAALASLRAEGVLIIGSGYSYHNLRLDAQAAREPSARFDRWLGEVMTLDAEQRNAALVRWSEAPAARIAHPREEHLLPLMVTAGAAAHEPARRIHHESAHFGFASISGFSLGSTS